MENTSRLISADDILQAVGRTDTAAIAAEVAVEEVFDAFFAEASSHAKLVTNQQLEEFFSLGQIHVQAQLSAGVLKRVRDGVADSRFMALGHADILIDQGLIDC